MPSESESFEKFLKDRIPGGHWLPGSFQSPTKGQKVDPSAWPACAHCGRKHPSAVCPFCGRIARAGLDRLDCIRKDGPCAGCRSCFHCEIEFEGTSCPACAMPRGWKIAACPFCGVPQAVEMPHWGDRCDLFTLDCAHCKTRFVSLCLC